MIYFDNAATSWPKPMETKKEVWNVMEHYGANPGRGAYLPAKKASEYMEQSRKEIAEFLGISKPEHLIFTGGDTESSNVVLKGSIKAGDHVIFSSLEHNATLRPLKAMEKRGVQLSLWKISGRTEEDLEKLESLIRNNTKMIVACHGSNVTGTLQHLKKIVSLAKNYGIMVFADMAQTAGILNTSVEEIGVDFASYAGHKSLLGYGGIGLLYIKDPEFAEPLIHGGTGFMSHLLNQPKILPSGFEAGTRNMLGIGSLRGGICYIRKRGMKTIWEHEQMLTDHFRKELKFLTQVRVYDPVSEERLPVVSLNVADYAPDDVASYLSEQGEVCVRSGLHCAPEAHEEIGTLDRGTVRFSFGPFNTVSEVDRACDLLESIKKEGIPKRFFLSEPF